MSGRGNWKGAHWRRNDYQARFSRDDGEEPRNSSRDFTRRHPPYPFGLKGKEIGMYFRSLGLKKPSAGRSHISDIRLDPERERGIRRLLHNIDKIVARRPRPSPNKKIFVTKSKINLFPSVTPKDEKVDPQETQDTKKARSIKTEEADFIPLAHSKAVKEEVKTEEENIDIKQEEVTSSDMSESEDNVCGPRNHEFVLNPLNPISKKYKHIEDSQFKHNFLQSITGSIQDNLQRCLDSQTSFVKSDNLDNAYKRELFEKETSNRHYQRMRSARQRLPSFKKQHEIIRMVEENQVCLISGETGCGKTTQVAQFILDDYIRKGRGSECRVICTQPRRISAISVAERVADERAEALGKSVGYQIRLEKEMPRRVGSILFCTTGVLLQYMQSEPALTQASHIILDEIHERDTLCDFVLTILKDIISKRKDLRIVLMSATLDAEQFSKYYNNCPSLNIPGFTYPVTEMYLEDILQMTRVKLNFQAEAKGRFKHLKRNKIRAQNIRDFKVKMTPYVKKLRETGRYSEDVLEMICHPDSEDINLTVVFELIRYICVTQPEGGILVFLPGWDKISTLNRRIAECGYFPSDRYVIIPLHSLMPTSMQKSIFNRPPPGVRKIVLSTNIAETSITIDDIVYVIDTGKTKLKNFDVENNISTLQPEWISLANAKQRRGRAGRVQPGICYHTYSQLREQTMEHYALPEMLRTRLEEVILQIKILQLGKVTPFLQRVIDPPNPKAVDISLKLLQGMNALDEDENLTPLGYHLARLPMDPQTGKMILMGAIFSCVDPVFSVAASLSFKDAFLIPLGREAEVNQRRDELSGGTKSDHWVIAEAFRRWETAEKNNRGYAFCRDYFLSSNTLVLLRDMKRQFAENLHDMNFLTSSNPKDRESNRNSNNITLVKAIICAGLYPNVAILEHVKTTRKGIVHMKLRTPEDGKVQIHPRSINERNHKFESPFLVYHLKLKSSAIYLHDTTMVHAMSLLFFGEALSVVKQDNITTIAINKFIKFVCKPETAFLIKELKERLDHLLEHKINQPGVINWADCEGILLRAIIELITYEDNRMQLTSQEGDDDDGDDEEYDDRYYDGYNDHV